MKAYIWSTFWIVDSQILTYCSLQTMTLKINRFNSSCKVWDLLLYIIYIMGLKCYLRPCQFALCCWPMWILYNIFVCTILYMKFSSMRLQQESATVAFVVKESVPDSFVMLVHVCAILVHLLSNCLHCRMLNQNFSVHERSMDPVPFLQIVTLNPDRTLPGHTSISLPVQ